MSTLSIANFKILADKLAKGYETARLRFASEANSTASLNYMADRIQTAVLGYTDPEQTDALIQASIDLCAATENNRIYTGSGVLNFLRKLNAHVGGIDAYLTTNTARVHPYFARMCSQAGIGISAANTFPPNISATEPADDTLMNIIAYGTISSSIAITGATTLTFTHGAGISTTYFGKANWVITPENAPDTETTLVVTMTKIDGTSENKTVVMPQTLTAPVDIGTHDSDMYVDCTAATVTGGTNTDEFSVSPEVERTIAL